MADHRDPAWWRSLAEQWKETVASLGLLAAAVGGVAYKGVRWWRRIRRAARGGDSERPPSNGWVEPPGPIPPPPPPRHDTPDQAFLAAITRLDRQLILREEADRENERRNMELELRLRDSERQLRTYRDEMDRRLKTALAELQAAREELAAEREARRQDRELIRVLEAELAELRRRRSGDHRPV